MNEPDPSAPPASEPFDPADAAPSAEREETITGTGEAPEPEDPPAREEEDPEGQGDDEEGTAARYARIHGSASAQVSGRDFIGHNIINLGEGYVSLSAGGDGSTLEAISLDHFETLDAQALDDRLAVGRPDQRQVAQGRDLWIQSGLVFLVGKPGSGRGTFALSMARELVRTRVAHRVLVSRRLEAQVRIDPSRLDQGLGKLDGTLVIFEDALAYQNRDLSRFFREHDVLGLVSLASRLADQGTRLLFTLSEHEFSGATADLEASGLALRLPPPPLAELVAALRKEARGLHSDSLTSEQMEVALEALVDRADQWVAERFDGIPDLVRFCRRYLVAVLEGRLDLEAALIEHSTLSTWFLDTASQDREAWCELVALTLASAMPSAAAVPALAHRRLAAHLSAALRRDLEEKDQARKPSDLFTSHLEARSFATVGHGPGGLVLRFEDPNLPGQLWDSLLGSGRAVSWWLVDQLGDLCLASDPLLRRIASQSLGRIGELSPESLFKAPLRSWEPVAEKRPEVLRDAVPNLFAGALASRRPRYREEVLDWMRGGLRSDLPLRITFSSICLPVLADLDTPRALDELRSGLDHRFERNEDQTGLWLRRLGWLGPAAERAQAQKKQWTPKWPFTVLSLSPVEGDRTFLAGLGYALTGFCLGTGRIEVLRRLADWIEDGEGPIARLLCLVFFLRDGVLDTVERNPVQVRRNASDEWPDQACSRFLASAMVENGAEDLVRFFESAYARCADLPGFLQTELRNRLLHQLREWGGNPPEGEVEETLVEVLSGLRYSGNGELRGRVFDLLQHDSVFSGPDAPGCGIARKVLALR